MLPCFGSTNHKGEIASLQGLQEYGKSWKESFTRENSFANEMYRTFKLTFVPVNGAWFSLKWRAQESKKKGNAENGRSILLTKPTKRCLAS